MGGLERFQDDSLSQDGNMRVLITGVNGFIGAHVASKARQTGVGAVGLDLPGSEKQSKQLYASLCMAPIECIAGDILSDTFLLDTLLDRKIDCIIHLAGSTRRDNAPEAWCECMKSNALATAAVIQAILSCPATMRPVLILPGSQMEYGSAVPPWTEETLCTPLNAYGASKLAATECVAAACRASLLRACVVRLPLVFGPGQRPTMFVPELITSLLCGKRFQMTEGNQRRRFLYVDDVATFLLDIAMALVKGKELPILINAPALRPIRIRDLALMLGDILGLSENLEIGALPLREGEPHEAWPDTTKADNLTSIPLTLWEKALGDTVKWYQASMGYSGLT
jgi:nucleoside-diphosphate-sugar epimerase